MYKKWEYVLDLSLYRIQILLYFFALIHQLLGLVHRLSLLLGQWDSSADVMCT